MSDFNSLWRFFRSLPAAAALVALTGVGYRLIPGRPGPADAGGGERETPRATRADAPAPAPRETALPASLPREIPRPAPPPPEVQTAALREASIGGAVEEIRSAARRGDRAMIRGLLPGLRRQAAPSRKALGAALQSETDPRTRAVLLDALADLD
jgi:hypothetical protein